MEALLQKKAFKDRCRFDSKILIRIQSTQNILYGALIVTQITKTMLNEWKTTEKIQGGFGIANFQASYQRYQGILAELLFLPRHTQFL